VNRSTSPAARGKGWQGGSKRAQELRLAKLECLRENIDAFSVFEGGEKANKKAHSNME